MSEGRKDLQTVIAALGELFAVLERLRGEFVHGIKSPVDYERAIELLDELTDGRELSKVEEKILVELEDAMLAYQREGEQFRESNFAFEATCTPVQLIKDLIEQGTDLFSGSELPFPHDRKNHDLLFIADKDIAMSPNKACPVVLSTAGGPRILLFRHPLAGVQLVKGTIETGETPAQAALRELHEESGIAAASVIGDLGCWDAGHLDQIWSFQLCAPQAPLPQQWTHQTLDDHGHLFSFFWAPLDDLPLADCHPVFRRALLYLIGALAMQDCKPPIH